MHNPAQPGVCTARCAVRGHLDLEVAVEVAQVVERAVQEELAGPEDDVLAALLDLRENHCEGSSRRRAA